MSEVSSSELVLPTGTPPNQAARTLAGSWRYTFLRGSQFFFGFASLLVTAHALGPVGRAQYALPLVLAMVVYFGMSLSLDQAAGRMLARRSASVADLSRLLSAWVLGVGITGAGVTLIAGLILRDDLLAGTGSGVVVLAAASVPLSLAIQMSLGLLLRLGALRAHGFIVAGAGGGQLLVMIVVAAVTGLTPFRAVLIIVAGTCVTAIALVAVLARYAGPGGLVPRPKQGLLRTALTAAWPLHLATALIVLNLRVDLFVVSVLEGSYQTGLYTLSTALAESVFLVPYVVTVAAMPTQTLADAKSGPRYTLDFARQSFSIGVVAAGLAVLLAYPLIRLLFGSEWDGSIAPFMLLALAAIAFAIEGPVRTYLNQIARPTEILFAAAVGTAINVGLLLVLIPPLGILGAALGSLVSYWSYTLLLLRVFRRRTGLSPWSVLSRPRRDDLLPQLWHRLTLGRRR